MRSGVGVFEGRAGAGTSLPPAYLAGSFCEEGEEHGFLGILARQLGDQSSGGGI